MSRASAVISECGKYRYHLQRVWDESRSRICWIMLNPSTADAEQDDPTIRRVIGFSRSWGAGGIDVVNLFALRATNPAALKKCSFRYAVGPENDSWIFRIAESPDVSRVIAAWGRHGEYGGRDHEVLTSIRRHVEQVGEAPFPRHPLYLKSTLLPIEVKRAGYTGGRSR